MENSVAKEIDCPCGQTGTGENDDQLVANTEEHMREKHPEMVGRSRARKSSRWHTTGKCRQGPARISKGVKTEVQPRIRVLTPFTVADVMALKGSLAND
jgi:hypothetical protein